MNDYERGYAAALAEVRAKMEALRTWTTTGLQGFPVDAVDRAAVLALLDAPAPSEPGLPPVESYHGHDSWVRPSDVNPGPVIIHSSKVAHRPVSEETIKKLRLIGADRDTIAFAERQAAKSCARHTLGRARGGSTMIRRVREEMGLTAWGLRCVALAWAAVFLAIALGLGRWPWE